MKSRIEIYFQKSIDMFSEKGVEWLSVFKGTYVFRLKAFLLDAH